MAARRRGVRQRRFWEYMIRDHLDLKRHGDRTRYNPVRHGAANGPRAWPYSTFKRVVDEGGYSQERLYTCHDRCVPASAFDELVITAIE